MFSPFTYQGDNQSFAIAAVDLVTHYSFFPILIPLPPSLSPNYQQAIVPMLR